MLSKFISEKRIEEAIAIAEHFNDHCGQLLVDLGRLELLQKRNEQLKEEETEKPSKTKKEIKVDNFLDVKGEENA